MLAMSKMSTVADNSYIDILEKLGIEKKPMNSLRSVE